MFKNIKNNSMRYMTLMIDIIHPYVVILGEHKFEDLITVCYRGETLNGLPHGLGQVDHSDIMNKLSSFKGFVTMTNGKIHGGPAIFIRGDGVKQVFDTMVDGRAQGMGRLYHTD
jgi:hypothetical protein